MVEAGIHGSAKASPVRGKHLGHGCWSAGCRPGCGAVGGWLGQDALQNADGIRMCRVKVEELVAPADDDGRFALKDLGQLCQSSHDGFANGRGRFGRQEWMQGLLGQDTVRRGNGDATHQRTGQENQQKIPSTNYTLGQNLRACKRRWRSEAWPHDPGNMPATNMRNTRTHHHTAGPAHDNGQCGGKKADMMDKP